MNYLKIVNDQFGHTEGDKLLITAATILREQLKSAENIYRLGGDEFVAIYLSPDEHIVQQEMENVNHICLASKSQTIPLRSAMEYASGNISEIINSIIGNGFELKRFDEHPAWEDQTLPGEFTAIATKKGV